jgi:hypothetical protein
MRRFRVLVVLVLAANLSGLAGTRRTRPDAPGGRESIAGRAGFDLREVGVWPFGPSQTVTCDPSRGLLFVGAGRTIQVYSVSDPVQPARLGPSFCLPQFVTRLEYDSGSRRLYAAGSAGAVGIWDASDPESPKQLGLESLPGPAYGLFVDDTVLYCALYDQCLVVVLNVRDPAAMVELCRLELEYEPFSVLVAGDVAYVGCSGAVEVLDVSRPEQPRVASIYEEESADVMALRLSGWLLYMATDMGVSIADVSDPYAIQYVSCTEDWDQGYALDLELDGWYAYIGDDEGNLAAIDVSNPAYPVEAMRIFQEGDGVYDVCRAGATIFGAAGTEGVMVADVTHPAGPEVLCQFGSLEEYCAAVVAESGYVYSWIGESLEVWDLSSPRSPRLAGACQVRDAEPDDAVVSDGHLYWSTGVLSIADVRDPANPRVLSDSFELESERIAVAGGYLYSPSGEEWLYVIDVTDPARPRQQGYVSVGGAAVDAAVTGHFCCVAAEEGGLVVLDISDPANPVVVGRETSHVLTRVEAQGSYAYATGEETTLVIYDLVNPAAPKVVGSYDNDDMEEELQPVTDGRYVYYASLDIGLCIVEVVDPSRPREVARLLQEDYPMWVAADRGVVYAATEERGILALDAENPAAMHEVARIPGWGGVNSVAAAGGRMFVAQGSTGLVTLDATSLPLQEVARADTLGTLRFVTVSGDRLYMLAGSGVAVADIGIGSVPRVLGRDALPRYGRGLAAAGGYAFVADYSDGFVIVDATDPTQLHPEAHVYAPRRASGVAVKGDYAYVSNYETSSRSTRFALYTFDVSDPASPRLLDSCGIWRRAYDVAVGDSYAYVACGRYGIGVASLADPAHPQPCDSFFGTRDYRKLFISGRYLYTASDENGLHIFDLVRPDKPELVAEYDTPGSALGVFADERYVYVADGVDGALMLGKKLVWADEDVVSRVRLHVLQNPARSVLECELALVEGADIRLGIYDAAGRLVRVEQHSGLGAGRHRFDIGLAGLPAGAYFLRAAGPVNLPTRKFVLAR